MLTPPVTFHKHTIQVNKNCIPAQHHTRVKRKEVKMEEIAWTPKTQKS